FGIVPHLLAAHLTSQAQDNFEWKDASGKTRNRSDLEEILGKHNERLRSGGKSGVDRALFEPKSLPALRGIAAARGLELLTYGENPDSLSTPQAISRRRLPGSGTGDYVR